jgi:hypothetical protein
VLSALIDEFIAARITVRLRQAQQLPGRIVTADKLAGTILIRPIIELPISARRGVNWSRLDRHISCPLGNEQDFGWRRGWEYS